MANQSFPVFHRESNVFLRKNQAKFKISFSDDLIPAGKNGNL